MTEPSYGSNGRTGKKGQLYLYAAKLAVAASFPRLLVRLQLARCNIVGTGKTDGHVEASCSHTKQIGPSSKIALLANGFDMIPSSKSASEEGSQ